MRHNKKFNHLGRTSAHRKAMLANMASSLILSQNKRITTTLAKAKALRTYVEPLITKTKNINTVDEKRNAQRLVFSYLQNKYAVKELFTEVGEKVAERNGGYTRILKLGNRLGDNAATAMIEFVDYNENMLKEVEEWRNVKKICCADHGSIFGLTNEWKVLLPQVQPYENRENNPVTEINDIVLDIAANFDHFIALTVHGKIIYLHEAIN